uniref:Uncharacterized protein n=1 Tax=Opuntia streptacantha TaxID=393608 RepID=A0A7C9AJI2_OPUST
MCFNLWLNLTWSCIWRRTNYLVLKITMSLAIGIKMDPNFPYFPKWLEMFWPFPYPQLHLNRHLVWEEKFLMRIGAHLHQKQLNQLFALGIGYTYMATKLSCRSKSIWKPCVEI